jgi:hypothetical protein
VRRQWSPEPQAQRCGDRERRDQQPRPIESDQAERLGEDEQRARGDDDLGQHGDRSADVEQRRAEPVRKHEERQDQTGQAQQAEHEFASRHRLTIISDRAAAPRSGAAWVQPFAAASARRGAAERRGRVQPFAGSERA